MDAYENKIIRGAAREDRKKEAERGGRKGSRSTAFNNPCLKSFPRSRHLLSTWPFTHHKDAINTT